MESLSESDCVLLFNWEYYKYENAIKIQGASTTHGKIISSPIEVIDVNRKICRDITKKLYILQAEDSWPNLVVDAISTKFINNFQLHKPIESNLLYPKHIPSEKSTKLFNSFPDEILVNILEKITDMKTIQSVLSINKKFYDIGKELYLQRHQNDLSKFLVNSIASSRYQSIYLLHRKVNIIEALDDKYLMKIKGNELGLAYYLKLWINFTKNIDSKVSIAVIHKLLSLRRFSDVIFDMVIKIYKSIPIIGFRAAKHTYRTSLLFVIIKTSIEKQINNQIIISALDQFVLPESKYYELLRCAFLSNSHDDLKRYLLNKLRNVRVFLNMCKKEFISYISREIYLYILENGSLSHETLIDEFNYGCKRVDVKLIEIIIAHNKIPINVVNRSLQGLYDKSKTEKWKNDADKINNVINMLKNNKLHQLQ